MSQSHDAAYMLDEGDVQRTRDLLVGRRIVKAERGEWKQERWYDPAPGRLTLDDGTIIYVKPNIGGCSCGAGDYELEHLATVENAITVSAATNVGGSGARSNDSGGSVAASDAWNDGFVQRPSSDADVCHNRAAAYNARRSTPHSAATCVLINASPA